MSEHPILFSGPMVNAILADLKTMTRRVMRGVNGECSRDLDFRGFPANGLDRLWFDNESGEAVFQCQSAVDDTTDFRVRCPYGGPGDTIWVRTAYRVTYNAHRNEATWTAPGMFIDTHGRPLRKDGRPMKMGHKPAMHMPHWLSAEAYPPLRVIAMRVERVQDISEADVKAEGISLDDDYPQACPECGGFGIVGSSCDNSRDCETCGTLRGRFSTLWDSINAKPRPRRVGGKIVRYESYPWKDIRETREHRGLPWEIIGNPYVWVPEFERER